MSGAVDVLAALPDCITRFCSGVELVGSRATCVPAPQDTDQDILCFVKEQSFPDLLNDLSKLGWVFDGSEFYANALDEGVGFRSYRHGEINLVLTTDAEFFQRFMAATSIAARLNLLVKDDRIALFQAVLYGNSDLQALARIDGAA